MAEERSLSSVFIGLGIVMWLTGCGPGESSRQTQDEPLAARTLDRIAEDYVHLVLAMNEYDPGYVDA